MSEMSAATEKAREKIERVVMASRSTLLVLIESIMAILVVNTAGFGVREGVVGFGDIDKLLMCRVVSTIACCVSLLESR